MITLTKEQLQNLRKELESRLAGELELWYSEQARDADPSQIDAVALNSLAMILAAITCKNWTDVEPNLLILQKLHGQMQDEVKKLCTTAQRARILHNLYLQFQKRK